MSLLSDIPKFGSKRARFAPSNDVSTKCSTGREEASTCQRLWWRSYAANRAADARAPAGRGTTDARHSRGHARTRSHHGPRAATVTPESLEAAGKLPCATTQLSSLNAAVVTRRRRRVTSFAFPSGSRQRARLYTSDSLCNDGGPEYADSIYGTDCADCGPRFPRIPPPPPICAETCNWASDADCDDGSPGSEFCRPWTISIQYTVKGLGGAGVCVYVCYNCTAYREHDQ